MTIEDYMKLSKQRLAEILAERDAREEFARGIYRGWFPTEPTSHPFCYEPGGICVNPQMDCVNCPRRGSGGFSINTIGTK